MSLHLRHNWQLVGTRQLTQEDLSFGSPGLISHHTRFLYICTICKKPKVKTIDGFWEWEEVVETLDAVGSSL